MVTMDLNAGYRCSCGLCCFSMVRSEGHEALVAIEKGMTICQHHLHMAFMRLAHAVPGRPPRRQNGAIRGNSWGSSYWAFQESPTAVPRLYHVPVALPSRNFDFVPSTSPSCAPKLYAPERRTPYSTGGLKE